MAGLVRILLEWTAMRFSTTSLLLALICSSPATRAVAQDAAPATSSPVASEGSVKTPSSMLQPALTKLQGALAGLKPEKWKVSGEMREEAAGNIRSINRDLSDTLPPLLTNADADPTTVSKVLPVSRNIDAVYDVALRVAATGKSGAPQQQSAPLDDAMASLQDARRQLEDQMQTNAVAQEKRVADLQTALSAAQQAPPQAPAPVVRATPPTPTKLRKPKARPKPAPVTPSSGDAAPKP